MVAYLTTFLHHTHSNEINIELKMYSVNLFKLLKVLPYEG